jgi:hypothetical protein
MKENKIIIEYIESSGYKKTKNYHDSVDRLLFCKVLWKDDELVKHVCKLNEHLQLCLYYHEYSLYGKDYTSFELEVVHETVDSVWIDFKYYTLTEEDILTNLRMYETKLIKAWNSVNE